jgi:hypothetical protein
MSKLIDTAIKFLIGEPAMLKNNGSPVRELIRSKGEDLTDVHIVQKFRNTLAL